MTSSQIKALHATPQQIIAAPGSGKGIVIVGVTAKFIYGGSNVFTAAASQTINIYYNNNTTAAITTLKPLILNSQIISSSNSFSMCNGQNIGPTSGFEGAAAGVFDNVNVAAYNPQGTEISGNAANNNTIDIQIGYYIVTF